MKLLWISFSFPLVAFQFLAYLFPFYHLEIPPTCHVVWFDQLLAFESQLKFPLGWEPSASLYPTPKVSVPRKWVVRKKTTFKNWHACSHLWKKRNLSKHSHLAKVFSCLKEVLVFQSATSNTTFWVRVTCISLQDMVDHYVKWHWWLVNGRSVNQEF